MKKIILFVIGLLLLIVENSVLNYFSIFGYSINLILIYIVFISLYIEDIKVGILAALLGLIKDTTVGGILGLNGLMLFVTAYAIGYMREKFYKDSYITIVILVVLATIFNSIVSILFSSMIYRHYGILTLVVKGFIVAPIVNGFVSLILYRLTRKLVLKLKED